MLSGRDVDALEQLPKRFAPFLVGRTIPQLSQPGSFCFNQFGDCEGALLRPGNAHSAGRRREVLPVVQRYQQQGKRLLFRARRCLRQAGGVRVPGGPGHRLRHPPAR